MTFVMTERITKLFLPLCALGLAISPALAYEPIPAKYDHAFPGRLIVEQIPYFEMRDRCKGAIDLRPGEWSEACSWKFRDGLNSYRYGCHIVLARLSAHPSIAEEDAQIFAIRTETANCNGWHDYLLRGN